MLLLASLADRARLESIDPPHSHREQIQNFLSDGSDPSPSPRVPSPPRPSITLTQLLQEYLLEHELKPSTAENYRDGVSAFSTWLRREATVDDLCSETINLHLTWMQEVGRAVETRKSRRRALLTFWRFAIESGHVDRPVRRVRTIKAPEAKVDAWTEGEIRKLLQAARATKGYLRSGIAKAAYWESLILAAWDTALRLGDLLALEYRAVKDSDGSFAIVQKKTGHVKPITLRPDTLEAIDRCVTTGTSRELIWPYAARREEFYKAFKRIVLRAGIRRGTFRWIRRASTTAVEKLQPGGGKHQAGHRDEKVTRRHYLDASQLGMQAPLPPALSPAAADSSRGRSQTTAQKAAKSYRLAPRGKRGGQ